MERDKLVEQMLKEKGDVNNSIDLDAYARGLIDMYDKLVLQQKPSEHNSPSKEWLEKKGIVILTKEEVENQRSSAYEYAIPKPIITDKDI